MIKTLTAQHKEFQQKFVLAWVVTTLAFVLVIFISLWQFTYSRLQHQFDTEAHALAYQLEEIFKDILGSLNAVPVARDTTVNTICKDNIHHIENIVFGSLYLSGIVISDRKHKAVCTTGGGAPALLQTNYPVSRETILLGPVDLDFGSKPAYYVQKNFSDYRINGFFLKTVLDNVFIKDNHLFDFTGLYATNSKTTIYSKGTEPEDTSFIKRFKGPEIIGINPNGRSFEAVLSLTSLDNVKLIIYKKNLGFFGSLSRQMLLYLLPLLILSAWFFRYSKQLIRKRFSINHALNTALKEGQFFPVYQPIYDAQKKRFMGAEILIRWKTEFNETILPKFFIEEAEKSGLIVPITLQLMERAFQECQPLFHKKSPLKLSFNVSPAHFKDKEFFTKFYQLAEHYAVPPHQITLELTERGLFDGSDGDLAGTMQEIRSRGFSLSLDDFGTGQANINYLQQFPFNYLKIDQIFIKTIGTGAIIESLNQGIINIARSLQLEIIAEGVETEEQVAYLKENNVIYMQGWFYAKAMPYKAFSKLLDGSKKDR